VLRHYIFSRHLRFNTLWVLTCVMTIGQIHCFVQCLVDDYVIVLSRE
jgi:hypothetical protein